MKSFITSHPILFGALIGVLLLLAIGVIETWFPSVDDAWTRHDALVRSIWFTAGFCVLWVGHYWRWRRRGFFWGFICVFLLVHSLGVFYYSAEVHPLVVWQWIVLLMVESYVAVFGMSWCIRRFARNSAILSIGPKISLPPD
jgi:hypothetical protein